VSVADGFFVFIQYRTTPITSLLAASARPSPVDSQTDSTASFKRLVSLRLSYHIDDCPAKGSRIEPLREIG
jgi:hypothetical protein